MTDAGAPSVRVFQPHNRLKQKVGTGSRTLPAEVPPAFQTLMQGSIAEYARHLDAQVRQLQALATAGNGVDAGMVFAVAHQIRGEAHTFGYAAVGRIADSLCKFLEAGGTARTRSAAVITLHVDAMSMITAECTARGDGTAATVAQTLLDGLGLAVRHVLSQRDGGEARGQEPTAKL